MAPGVNGLTIEDVETLRSIFHVRVQMSFTQIFLHKAAIKIYTIMIFKLPELTEQRHER